MEEDFNSSNSFDDWLCDENINHIIEEQPQEVHNEEVPGLQIQDNTFLLSFDIIQTRLFLYQNLHLTPRNIYNSDVNGLVILSLNDFSLIRQDRRYNRVTPHCIFINMPDAHDIHPELVSISNNLREYNQLNKI